MQAASWQQGPAAAHPQAAWPRCVSTHSTGSPLRVTTRSLSAAEGNSGRPVELMGARWKINGAYYDLRQFASVHPGGAYAINLSANHDVTDLFYSYHRATALARVESFRDVSTPNNSPRLHGEPFSGDAIPDPRMAKLRAHVEKRTGVRSLRELTTPPVGVMFNGILGAAYGLAIVSWFIHPTVVNSVATGVLGWLFGGFIQHEACHSALSRRTWVNHVGRFLIVPWADPRTWFCRHVVEHHPYTNTRADCDFQTEEGVLAIIAHHGCVAAGPITPWQLVVQLVGGSLVRCISVHYQYVLPEKSCFPALCDLPRA